MATVTGTLNDCGLGHLTGKAPELVFTLSDPVMSPAGLFVTDPVRVTPATNGTWSATLADTETMQEPRFYTLQARWLDAANNYVSVDFPDWHIFVPIVGGTLPELTQNYSTNPFMVIYQATEPDPWPLGVVWLDTSINTATSGDLKRRTA